MVNKVYLLTFTEVIKLFITTFLYQTLATVLFVVISHYPILVWDFTETNYILFSFPAALELITTHAPKFSEDLLKNYDTLFPWLMKWCSYSNRDDHKAAIPAMDTFITVIANAIELQDASFGIPVFKVKFFKFYF